MNPNTTGERTVNFPGNPGMRVPEVSSLGQPQQFRPLRPDLIRPENRNINAYQQNYQSPQPSNIQQNPQQNMYQFQQQQNYQQMQQQNFQRQQQNLRFPLNQDPMTTLPQHNNEQQNAYRNSHRDPGVQSEQQRIQMAPQMRPSGPQQLMKPPFNNPNYSTMPNQIRTETPRTPNDRMQSNFQNEFQTDQHKTQVLKNHTGNLERKPSELDLNSHKPNISQNGTEAAIKQEMRLESNLKNETSSEQLKKQTPPPVANDSDSTPDKLISAEKNKTVDLESSFDKKATNSDVGKKGTTQNEEKNNVKDESITIGMVKKNIKFFEESDTAKKPLKPETLIPNNPKNLKVESHVIKRVSQKNENESGVDETPVIHPNLKSIFQAPRKVAKIPHIKNKLSKKLKSKKTLNSNLNKKSSSEYLKFQHVCMHFKKSNGKKPKTRIYGSKEELLAFFENTESWRRLNSRESKLNENVKKGHKPTANGDISTPKTPSKLQTPSKRNLPTSPSKTPGSPGISGAKSLPKTPESPAPPTPLIKKVPMNKIQVGAAPSPNLKVVKSKVGSLANTTHKPGGGNVKIESHKIDLTNVQPRTEAKNEQYKRSGGDKKIQQVKLQWNAKSKIGSLENATYKPGGGDKKIESVKLDFKEKAKPKVGSKENVKHTPGGGNVKIENQKLEFKVQSKVGSLDNVKHKPGGGDIKIFDDKTYLRQISGNSSEGRASGTQGYGSLSIMQEVQARSVPTTPGKSTSIKLKKTTTIENFQETPKIKKVTEVTVTSQRLERKTDKSPTKVKVIYSKIDLPKTNKTDDPVEFIRIPANTDAPVLKPSLSKKDINDPITGMQDYNYGRRVENISLLNNGTENIRMTPKSSDLSEVKFRSDLGVPKFFKDEIGPQEKIGEMWQERNFISNTSNLSNSREHQE